MADKTNDVVADTAEAVAANAVEAAEGVKAKFSKAIDEARASAVALGKDLQDKLQDKAAPYREKLSSGELLAEAKAFGEQAKDRALELASDGKVKASDAITSLGKVVADNAGIVDDKLGAKFGDYARSAARALQETGAKLESKDLEELGKEATEFVKKNPVIAAGALIAVGFALTKLLGSKSDEA